MIPVQDIISLFLAFCGGISILGTAAVYVAKAVGWIRRPEVRQNETLRDHEDRIARLEDKVGNDYTEIKRLQREMKMVLRAVVAIMKHELDDNDKDGLKKIQGDIETYLLEK